MRQGGVVRAVYSLAAFFRLPRRALANGLAGGRCRAGPAERNTGSGGPQPAIFAVLGLPGDAVHVLDIYKLVLKKALPPSEIPLF